MQTEKVNDTCLVKPEGKITAATADQFREELGKLVEDGNVDITIDLRNVDMLDSKGLAVFVMCHQSLSAKGGNLTVVTENADFRGLFHVMRLDEHFSVVETL